jgi:hypothetical protein
LSPQPDPGDEGAPAHIGPSSLPASMAKPRERVSLTSSCRSVTLPFVIAGVWALERGATSDSAPPRRAARSPPTSPSRGPSRASPDPRGRYVRGSAAVSLRTDDAPGFSRTKRKPRRRRCRSGSDHDPQPLRWPQRDDRIRADPGAFATDPIRLLSDRRRSLSSNDETCETDEQEKGGSLRARLLLSGGVVDTRDGYFQLSVGVGPPRAGPGQSVWGGPASLGTRIWGLALDGCHRPGSGPRSGGWRARGSGSCGWGPWPRWWRRRAMSRASRSRSWR